MHDLKWDGHDVKLSALLEGLKTVSNLGIESHSGKIFLGHYLLGCFFEE